MEDGRASRADRVAKVVGHLLREEAGPDVAETVVWPHGSIAMLAHEQEVQGRDHRRAKSEVHAAHRKEPAVRHPLRGRGRLEAVVRETKLRAGVKIGHVRPQTVVDHRRHGRLSDLVWEPTRSYRPFQRVPPAVVIPSPVKRAAYEAQE